ncbi:MAG TPA: transporter [Burkholderiales bacterium]
MRAALAVLALLAAPAALAADEIGGWSGGAGLTYTTGDYGTGRSTSIWTVPFMLRYEAAPWTLKLTLPWYEVSGDASVVPGLGAVDRGRRRSGSVTGFGDLTVAATNSAYYDSASRAGLDLTGKLKLPTGEEDKGLGTGSTDFTALAEVYKGFDRLTLFGGLGYTLYVGGNLSLKNTVSFSLGGKQALDARDSIGVAFDGRSQVADGAGEQRELMLFWMRSVDRSMKVQAYVLKGFADGSPDWGVGATLMHAF